MQIYSMLSRCSHRYAASLIYYEYFVGKSVAYLLVFTVVLIFFNFLVLNVVACILTRLNQQFFHAASFTYACTDYS